MRSLALLLACLLPLSTVATADDKISLGDAAEHAIQQSKITLPGSKPFHLKAEIIETTNPKSEYQATIEEYWVSPEKWRRTIESPALSQTLIVNGDKISEQDRGDYLPWWMSDLITAMVDPLPMSESLKKVNSQIAKPNGSENSSTCADLHTKIDRLLFCFEGSHGLVKSVFARGYHASFNDFKAFGDKRVARKIVIDPEPGTTIQATITLLAELPQPDDTMFDVKSETPPEGRIRSLRIDEDQFRKLSISNTDIDWPPAGGGMAAGGCAVYVSADRAGRIQEVWPGGCDNPGLQDPLREIVKKWQLKQPIVNGVRVQVESLLTFRFETKIVRSDAVIELSDAEARKLATNIVDPVFPQGSVQDGTDVLIRISVDETGKLTGVDNTHQLKDPAFLAAYHALGQWHFQPLVKDGKPQYFHADVVFHVP
ncbi:MAG: hypothetical protein WBD25_05455 [Terriglobales bacterium]|jgi:hypothetical protein